MKQYVLSFTNFVNENRSYIGEQPYIFQEYKDKFDDFPFENDVPFIIKKIEERWIGLKEKYMWNREQSGTRRNHFALNVKVYLFPDEDEVRKRLKVPELSEEEVNKVWWKYLQDQAEVLADGIDYSWVKDVSWGGKSGGWLLLHPNVTYDDVMEGIAEECNSYVAEKEAIEEEVMADVKSRYEDPDFSELVEVGALNDLPEINQLREKAKSLVNYLNETLGEVKSMEEDILEILKQVDNFKAEGLSWFYEYLEMEPDFALKPVYKSN